METLPERRSALLPEAVRENNKEDQEAQEARAMLTQAIRDILARRREKLIILTQDKTGRLFSVANDLFEACVANAGIVVTEEMRAQRQENKSLTYEPAEIPGLKIVSVRQIDMPSYVRDYDVDFAVIGEDALDGDTEGLEVKRLGVGKSSLFFGVPKESSITCPQDLVGKTIATSYKWALEKYLEDIGIKANIIERAGKVEAAPGIGAADAICDIVETGRSMKENNLRQLPQKIRNFQAVLISKKPKSTGS